MTISVIIPTLNEEDSIEATLREASGMGFHELIVVDGGSTDRTRSIVDEFASGDRHVSPVRLISAPPGRARQLNAGAAIAAGEVLLFLHADTSLPASARSSVQTAMSEGSVSGGRFDVRFDSASIWSYLISSLMNLRSRVTRIATGDQALFVRSSVFRELGGFSEIPLMEDVEFTSRLKRRGRTIALRDRVTTSFRRWERLGPLKTILFMWTLRFLYWIGVSPWRLNRWYKDVR